MLILRYYSSVCYIITSPVRIWMVEYPSEYQWSSYAGNSQGKSNILVQQDPLYFSFRLNV